MDGHSETSLYTYTFCDIRPFFSDALDDGLVEILNDWNEIYGFSNKKVVEGLIEELLKHFKEFWKDQAEKLSKCKTDLAQKIDLAGKQAVLLEKALGLNPQVSSVSSSCPLRQLEEQLQSILETYKEIKNIRLEEYFLLQKKEQELCLILDMKAPRYKLEGSQSEIKDVSNHIQCFVPTPDCLTEMKDRIEALEQEKEALEYNFEDVKSQLRMLLEECDITPLKKEERCAFGEVELAVTKKNLNLLVDALNKIKEHKEDMVAEANHLREEINKLARKMFKDIFELEEFFSSHSGFTVTTINKLKEKLKELREERKLSIKDLIANCRKRIEELWEMCCYSKDQRSEFIVFETSRISEEVLELHEHEVDKLESFYNSNEKIFSLAKQHEELWDKLLYLEDQSNNKERLFKNRGGCLLKEEKERKVIQKRLPTIKAQLIELINVYKEETGKDFLRFGKPLLVDIEMKEYRREMDKHQERLQRKVANTENLLVESRLGTRPVAGTKRKALPPQDNKFMKSMRTELPSSASSKSTLSSKSTTSSSGLAGTLVRKEQEITPYRGQQHLKLPVNNMVVRTPKNRMPAASTPQNGSLSYESFQVGLCNNP